MIRTFIVLLAGLSLTGSAQTPGSLEHDFRNPPVTARPRALWAWVNGNFDLDEITHELEEAKAKGMGGFDIWDISPVVDDARVVPPGEPFMSDRYVKAIGHAAREAKRLGLDLGLTIASGWNAGGPWVKPEHATLGLFRSERSVEGGRQMTLDLPYPELPKDYGNLGPAFIERAAGGQPVFSREVALLAFPDADVFDVSAVVDLSGKKDWDVPPGRWRIVRYVCANTGQPMFSHAASSNGPMLDHFNPEATEAHINYFLEKLKRELGDLSTSGLKYLYTDSYEVRGDLWTPRMLDEFRRRAGYDMTPYLPALAGRVIGSPEITGRFLGDYRRLLSDLIVEGHYAKATELCHRAGIQFAAEAAGPGQPIHNCPFESLKSSGSLDIPRGEFWHKYGGNNDQVQVVRGVASAAHVYGQRYVDAEAFTSVWLWQESLDELKPTADRAFCEGLNRIVYHTFPHTPKAAGHPGWVYSFGTQISEVQPWWPMARPFNDYLARTGHMLQQGNFAADVLIYYGDQAPNFVPARRWDDRLGFGYDFDYVNSDAIMNRLTVRNGRLALPSGQSYAALLLPDDEAMSLEVLRKLEALDAQGVKIFGPKPVRSYGLKDWQARDTEVRRIADRLWAHVKPWGDVRAVLPLPDLQVPAHEDSIDYIHRRTAGEDIYFLRNTTGRDVSTDAIFRVNGRVAQFWDPITGEIRPASNDNKVRLDLEPYGSMFVVFRNGGPQKIPAPIETRAIPVEIAGLGSWTDSADPKVRYFSGIRNYSTIIEAPKAQRVILDLGRVGMIAHVLVNGADAGVAWHAPYRVDVTSLLRPGRNAITIEVANTWPNRMIGDAKLPEGERVTHSNIRRLPNAWMYPLVDLPSEKYPLRPSGLLGPVRLLVN